MFQINHLEQAGVLNMYYKFLIPFLETSQNVTFSVQTKRTVLNLRRYEKLHLQRPYDFSEIQPYIYKITKFCLIISINKYK